MAYNLTAIRDKAGLKQHELANKLSWSQAQVSRYESNPKSITIADAEAWIEACGMTEETARALSEITGGPAPIEYGLNVGAPYSKLRGRLNYLEQYVEDNESRRSMPSADEEDTKNSALVDEFYTPNRFKKKIFEWRQKPNLVIAGRFDSGKSRLANALLGGSYLPSHWTPATALVTIVRHWEEDRPSWQEDEVLILDREFNPADSADKEACGNHRIASGGIEILSRYGDKRSVPEIESKVMTGSKAPGWALVYLKAPILQSCALVDLPGFESRGEQDEILSSLERGTDLLLYACAAIGFLDTPDFTYIGPYLRVLLSDCNDGRSLPSLRRILVVATHANKIRFPDDEINNILDLGSDRMYKALLINEKADGFIGPGDLRRRLFTFWAEEPSRRSDLESELSELLSNHLPRLVTNRVDVEIQSFKDESSSHFAKRIEVYQTVINELDSAPDRFKELQSAREAFKDRLLSSANVVDDCIAKCRSLSEEFIVKQVAPMLEADFIEPFIRKHYSENPKEAKQFAMLTLLEFINTQMELQVKNHVSKLKTVVDKFVNDLSKHSEEVDFRLEGRKLDIPFDIRGTIAGGIAGLGLGGLGTYLFTGHVFVSTLSIIGASSTAVAFLSAIGGPVTLIIALSSFVTLGTWALVSKSWEQRLANKLASELKKQDVIGLIKRRSDKYWDNAKEDFGTTFNMITDKYESYMTSLIELMETRNLAKIDQIIRDLAELKNFFEGIPWKSPVSLAASQNKM